MKIQVVGMAWYRREDYDSIRQIMDDGKALPPVYDDWLAAAERGFKKLTGDGLRIVRAEIDPATFPAWCATNGHKVNSDGRKAFANLRAFESVHNN
ncbi:MAG TPA: hypothetical protein VNQ90_02720 [Chthoniobacteraceae bacterium]|nr:hypothetical protein [Chthoniobacteraceae bacterium]